MICLNCSQKAKVQSLWLECQHTVFQEGLSEVGEMVEGHRGSQPLNVVFSFDDLDDSVNGF